jgi:hypothetical protein
LIFINIQILKKLGDDLLPRASSNLMDCNLEGRHCPKVVGPKIKGGPLEQAFNNVKLFLLFCGNILAD